MKECELCSHPAKMYCEADQASLCWDCDQKVHCANFLVAKHSRSLLCHVCQSPTSWKASGPKLGHTVSVCEACVANSEKNQERGLEGNEESRAGNEHEDEDDLEDDDHDEEDDDGSAYEDDDGEYVDDFEEEDGENQVVPWSSTLPPPLPLPPPPTASSSSVSEISSSRFSTGSGAVSSLKLMRDNADLDSEDDIASFSSRFNHDTTAVVMSFRA